MTSDRKAESNRQNSKKSTGPRTPRGKSHSRHNAIDTGLYADPRTFTHDETVRLNLFRKLVWAEYNPQGISECTVADELAFNMLRRYRLNCAERSFFDKAYGME